MNKPTALHCCEEMRTHLEDGRLPIVYVPKFREYGIEYPDGSSIQLIRYCPWCGKTLPASVRQDWFEELDRLGLEPEDLLPNRMKTDEWWRVQ